MKNTDTPCCLTCPQDALMQASCAWIVFLKPSKGKAVQCSFISGCAVSGGQCKSSASRVYTGRRGDTAEHKLSWKVWAFSNFARTLENICIDSALEGQAYFDRKAASAYRDSLLWAREDTVGWGHGFYEAGGKPLLGELAPTGWRWKNLARGRQTPLNARKKNVITCSMGILMICSSPNTLLSGITPTLKSLHFSLRKMERVGSLFPLCPALP